MRLQLDQRVEWCGNGYRVVGLLHEPGAIIEASDGRRIFVAQRRLTAARDESRNDTPSNGGGVDE